MASPNVAERYRYMTTSDVRKRLGLGYWQLLHRLQEGVFPPPTVVNQHGVRFFDENWLRVAQAILENSYEAQRKK